MEREILTVKKSEMLFNAIKAYKQSKNIKIGVNETIKAIKNGLATLVVLSNDSIPAVLTESVVVLCEQQGIKYVYVESKESLGKACSLEINIMALAFVERKDEDNTKMLKDLSIF